MVEQRKQEAIHEEKIKELKRTLIQYASLVENMIMKSINGLLNKKRELLQDVIDKDEPRANDFEVELDEKCTNFIAQFAPKAIDLRTVLMIMQMDNDLERMGDLAVNICQSSLFLIDKPLVKPLIDIPKLARETTDILKKSIDSLVKEDAALAKSACEHDEVIDVLRDQIIIELIAFMSADPKTIERSIHLMRIANNLERIADLSTNVCEDVIFMVTGRVIKHHFDED